MARGSHQRIEIYMPIKIRKPFFLLVDGLACEYGYLPRSCRPPACVPVPTDTPALDEFNWNCRAFPPGRIDERDIVSGYARIFRKTGVAPSRR